MRVVFDTTILVDGLFVANSPSSRALREVKRGRVQLVTSPSILGELQSVLQNQRFRQSELRAWLITAGLRSLPNVTVVQPDDVPGIVSGDAMDDHIVAAALASSADVIVATDHHLLDLKEFRVIKIVTPEEFMVLIGVDKAPPKPKTDLGDPGDQLAA